MKEAMIDFDKIAGSPLPTQIQALEEILMGSKLVREVLERSEKFDLPNWYLAAGAICQTVWNYGHGFPDAHELKDCDLVYCDTTDVSYEAEDVVIKQGEKIFGDLPVEVEIRNQARVYLWYEKRFGVPTQPYEKTEEGINTFPATASAVGIRLDNGKLSVYAPYGLRDIFAMIVRPNKTLVTEAAYNAKVERWAKVWPRLKTMPW
jgi:uncharacterized protein